MFTRYFTERKTYALAALATFTLLLLAGCGSNTSALSAKHAPSASATTMSNNTAMAVLKHLPSGMANFSWDEKDHMLTVKVALTGLAPNSTHPEHIHEGSCNNQGKILLPLQNLVADVHGVAIATSKVSASNGIAASGWYLDVHNGPGLATSDESLSIVCGDIVNHNTSLRSSQAVQMSLQNAAKASKGQNASGTAHLSLSAHTLTVVLTLSGLAPGSEHAAHIHAGSCASQGAVLYPLMTVKADSEGKATVTTTIPNVTSIPGSGWYVNVHHSTELGTQTGFDPITCGNVILSR